MSSFQFFMQEEERLEQERLESPHLGSAPKDKRKKRGNEDKIVKFQILKNRRRMMVVYLAANLDVQRKNI